MIMGKMRLVVLIVSIVFSLLVVEGRLPKRKDHSDGGDSDREGVPGLLFGDPQVYGSVREGESESGERAEKSSLARVPLSLEMYEKSSRKIDRNSDEGIVRNLIIKRFKRSPLPLPLEREKEDDYDEEEEQGRKKRDQEKAEEAARNSNGTSTTTPSSSSSPAPAAGTTTTTKATPGSTTPAAKPSEPEPIPRPSGNVNGTAGRPPSQSPFATRTGSGGSPPPGGPPRPGPGGPPRRGPPGKPPPGFLPPHLLFARMNSTRKPPRKGELYLPEDYNNLEIPKLDAGKLFGIKVDKLSPVPVLVFLNIRSVQDIDELQEEIVLDLDMKVEWVDGVLFDPFNALSKKPQKATTLNPVFLNKIWKPDIYIDEIVRVHKTELMATPHTLLFSSGTGLVSYTMRARVRLACEMDFFYYPSDTHKCDFHLRSYSYFDQDLDLGWLRNGVFLQDPGDPNFDLQISDVEEIKIDQVFREANNDTYDGLSFTVVARRKLSYHMVQTYLPSIFFIVITWLCFLVPARMVEARIGISMTTLLTLTAMFSSVRESTPIVSYVKAIDIWMVFCIFFVFLTLLEFSLLVWIRSFREDKEEKRLEHLRAMQEKRGSKRGGTGKRSRSPSPSPSVKSEDLKVYEQFAEFTEKWAFLIFSIVFLLFNIIYWSWLLNSSDYFNWAVNSTHNGALDDD